MYHKKGNVMKKILVLLIGCGTVLTSPAQTTSQVRSQGNESYTVVTPLSNSQFSTLLRKVRNYGNNNSRYQAATDAVSNTNYYFNTTQLRMLLESFTGDEQRLALAKLSYDRVTDKMNFSTLANVFSSQNCKDDLAAFSMGKDRSTVVYSFSESFRTPMMDANFRSSYNDIEVQWQEGARLSSIIDLFEKPSTYFTVAQVKELMELISDEGSKLHLAKAAYSKVTDPENFEQIYTLFKTQERLNSLTSYIGANARSIQVMAHNAGKTAMDATSYDRIYNDARNHFRNKSIIKAVNSAFADQNNFYSSYQARQLVLLIDGESDRLKAAKAAYRGVTDPSNFLLQMNDLFSAKESRDELESYVSNYR
jgi:hypothetical protein